MLRLVSIFSDGPDGKMVHIVDPTEVADVVAWLGEQGHQNIRLARSAEECEALLDEREAETAETGHSSPQPPPLGEPERSLRNRIQEADPRAQARKLRL